MVRVVLDRVVQIPNRATGRANQVLHGPVFEERGLEGPFLELSSIPVGRARRPRPYLRTPLPSEVEAILAIFAEEVAAGRMLPRNPEEVRANIGDWIIAEDNGEIVGCVSLVFFNPSLCELRSLAVAPRFQRNGLGSALIRAAIGYAQERGAAHVLTLTRATPVFQRIGFIQDSVFHYPEKVWKDCAPCPLRDRCDEVALVYPLQEEPERHD